MVTKSWALIDIFKRGKRNINQNDEMKNLNVLSLDRFIGNMKKRRLEGCVHDIWLLWLLVGKERKGTLFKCLIVLALEH